MTNDQDQFSHIPNPRLWEVVAGVRRVRWGARLYSLGLAVVCLVEGGGYWLRGLFLGWLVVEINLSLLVYALQRADSWRKKTILPLLIRFYLVFGATVVVCILIVAHDLGFPLAFLLGLLSFFMGLVGGLVSLIIRRPQQPS